MTPGLLLLATLACQLAQPQTYSIRGVVVDAVNNRPLAKTHVSVALTTSRATRAQQTITLRDGRFDFNGLPAGKYTLTAERIGYQRQNFNQRSLGNRYSTAIVVSADEPPPPDLVFRLVPGGVITGKITDPKGDPIPGLFVQALQIAGTGAARHVLRITGEYTDDRGIYRIANLAKGPHVVVATGNAARRNPLASVEPMAIPPTYFPGVSDAESSERVDVRAASESKADFVVHPVPAATLEVKLSSGFQSGSARDSVALALPGAFGPTIWSGWSSNFQASNQGATFADLPEGRYRAAVYHAGTRATGFQMIDVTAPVTHVTLADTPPVEVQVSLAIEGQSASGIRNGPYTVSFLSLDNRTTVSRIIPAPSTRLPMPPLEPGLYQPTVTRGSQPLPPIAMKARGEGATVVGAALQVPETGKIELDLVLDASAADVAGKASTADGKPAMGALVLLLRKSDWTIAGAYRTDQTDSDGSFLWKAVPRGDYLMVALDEANYLDYLDPASLSPLLPLAEPVTVAASSAPVHITARSLKPRQ